MIETIIIDGEEYQSYASVTKANRELAVDPELRSEWGDLEDANKKAFLVAATRRLDSLSWRGVPATSEQRSAWPRKGLFYENMEPIPEDAIPEEVSKAAALLAARLAFGESRDRDVQSEGIGPKSVSYYSRRRRVNALLRPGSRYLYSLIGRWLTSRLPENRVTGTERTEPDVFERTFGFS